MKNMYKVALLAVVGVGMVAPAFAQDNFPDTPENHWAFEALENLKREGILVGYPDGRYRGTRFMTRYEAAVAINAAYKKMMSMHSGLASQVEAIEAKMKGMNGGDNSEVMAQLADLKSQLAKMDGWGNEIASMKKMASTFEKELASLGVDVEGMKKDIATLKGGTVAGLPVKLSGEANVIVYAGNSRSGQAGMTKDGRIVGVDPIGVNPVGLTHDTNIYHDLALMMSGTNESGPTWNATLVFGNLISGIGGQNVRNGGNYSDNVSADLYIQDLAVKFNDSLMGLGFGAEVGRIGLQISPYIFQKINAAPYSNVSYYKDKAYRLDGATVKAGFGGATTLGITVGKINDRNTTNGVPINNVFGEGIAAAVLDVKVNDTISGKAAYVMMDSDTVVPAGFANRASVYGVDGTIKVAGFAINGGYAESQLSHNTSNIGPKGKSAYVNTDYTVNDRVKIGGEYRRINQNYGAAGSWRRIGTNWNPTDIETITGMLDVKLTDALSLSYLGEFGESDYNGAEDKITANRGSLNYKMNDNWKIMFGYEDVKIDIAGADIRQKWATFGFGYNLGTNSMLDFAYEYGSVQNPVAWGDRKSVV